MTVDIAPHYPCSIELLVFVTDGKGLIGKITYALPHGRHPTEAAIRDGMARGLAAVQQQMPDSKWALCDRHEFIGEIMSEKVGGMEFAVPGPKAFRAITEDDKITLAPDEDTDEQVFVEAFFEGDDPLEDSDEEECR